MCTKNEFRLAQAFHSLSYLNSVATVPRGVSDIVALRIPNKVFLTPNGSSEDTVWL